MKSALSYEEIPYPSKIFLETHPDRLATLAAFFGMNPPKVETCRVLELGCGDGFNLISHAFHLPDAQFVGTDLAENHIIHAKKSVEDLNLPNIEFHQADIMKMSAEKFGRFDYIIAHGVFSWVPDFVREKILDLCGEMLTENGVGYISYNAFPGSRHRQMAQELMRFHAAHFENIEDKVSKSVGLLSFVSENSSEQEVYAPILREELDRVLTLKTSDIFHDNLAEINQPFYFQEFAAMIGQREMQYLSESDVQKMGLQNLSPAAQEFISSLENIVEREQYLDFLRGQVFRKTLFCRRKIDLNRNPQPQILNSFLVTSIIRTVSENPDLAGENLETFISPDNSSVEINHPLTKAVLFHLSNIRGHGEFFPKLLRSGRKLLESQNFHQENWDEQFEKTTATLFQIYCESDLIDLHVFCPNNSVKLSEKPKISDLARWQFSQTGKVVTFLNLSPNIEDPISRRLFLLLDGTRNRDSILAELRRFIESELEFGNKQEILTNLPELFNRILEKFAGLGLFVS